MSSRDLSVSMFSSHISSMRTQILPYNQTVEQCERELSELLSSHAASARHVSSRISDISEKIFRLKNSALAQFGFIPEKLGLFCQSYDPIFQNWDWLMRDEGFQNPFQRFFSEVNRLSSRTDLTRADYGQLKFFFSQLPPEEKLAVLHYFTPFLNPSSSLASCPSAYISEEELLDILSNEARFNQMQPARLEAFLGRLTSEYLPLRTSLLGREDLNFLKQDVEKRARAEGVVIENWDLDWRHHHLYDSPERLLSSLSQVTLMRRNETLFDLWKSLRGLGSGLSASRLLMQCPLLEDVRRGRVLEVGSTVINELKMRAALLNKFNVLQGRLERKYPALKWIFIDPSHPLSKGMNEKRMQVILSPSLLFEQSEASSSSETSSRSKLVSSLESYLSIVNELARADRMEEADVKYLLNVANKQYTLRPSAETVEGEQSLLKLLSQAKFALRNRQLIPESGRVRQKEEQYQGLYFLREDDRILGKFKPLPDASLKNEMLGEGFNAILGTGFAPSADGVWLSIRKELLFIRSLLNDDRHEEAMKHFDLLDEGLRNEIYYLLFVLKMPIDPPDNYGALAWHGVHGLGASKEERIEVINQFLNPKRSLEVIRDCYNSGDPAQAMDKFRLLNYDLKHFIYYQLYLLKNPVNPPNEYGECAWNGHSDFPVTDEERMEVIERCLASDGLEEFVITRDPRRFHFKGTLQTWSQRCTEGTELLYAHQDAGEKMRRMPVSWVQMYNILAIIKGSGDCHSGNTLFQTDERGQFANLIDCDDEFIMPHVNHIDQIQIWTLGFPQASKPLLRPILKMLASSEFVDKWIKFVRTQCKNPTDPKVLSFEFRIHRIHELCREELEKTSISLTCQDLYFEIYGGREKFEELKRNESHRPEFVLFQYFMKEGMIQYLNEEAMRGPIFRGNVAALYARGHSTL